MRIISPFHDYYDTAMGWGHDPDLVYVRKTSVETTVMDDAPWCVPGRWGTVQGALTICPEFFKDNKTLWSARKAHVAVPVFEEGFVLAGGRATAVWVESEESRLTRCRKIATGDREEHLDPGLRGDVDLMALVDTCYRAFAKEHPRLACKRWSIPNPLAELKHPIPGDLFGVGSKEWRLYAGDTWDNDFLWRVKRWRPYHAAREAFLEKTFDDFHIEMDAPLLLLTAGIRLGDNHLSTRVVRNPCLRDLHWAKVADPYGLFQSLDQFLGGVMPRGTMPMVEISDKDKIEQKGFDPKYGFRHRPGNG